MACNIFDDAGCIMRAVSEGEEGVDLEALERDLKKVDERGDKKVSLVTLVLDRDNRLGGGGGNRHHVATWGERGQGSGISFPTSTYPFPQPSYFFSNANPKRKL